jgi:hypothetical protein
MKSKSKIRSSDEYSGFVDHPRYGRQPRITGLNPGSNYGDVFIHWHSGKECRIPNTAIPADLSRQTPATVQVTHYFDVTRQCRDCGEPFIFFAEEQKYWYEVLGFGLDSDCVKCAPCRKKEQGIAALRERYEALSHIVHRTGAESLEMAECCLQLLEASVFHERQLAHVRALLKQARSSDDRVNHAQLTELQRRVDAYKT